MASPAPGRDAFFAALFKREANALAVQAAIDAVAADRPLGLRDWKALQGHGGWPELASAAGLSPCADGAQVADGHATPAYTVADREKLRKHRELLRAARRQYHDEGEARRLQLLEDYIAARTASVGPAAQGDGASGQLLGGDMMAAAAAVSLFSETFFIGAAPLVLGLRAALVHQARSPTVRTIWFLDKAVLINGDDAFVMSATALLGALGFAPVADRAGGPHDCCWALRHAHWSRSDLRRLASKACMVAADARHLVPAGVLAHDTRPLSFSLRPERSSAWCTIPCLPYALG